MKFRIQIVVEHEDEEPTQIVEEVGCLSREALSPATLGMSLAEGKELLAGIQQQMVQHQVNAFIKENKRCPHCNKQRGRKDTKRLVMRTIFGKLNLSNPRLYTCSCQPQSTKSVTPLAHHLPERTTPELKYLQSKWSSLVSYGLTVDLLEEALPLTANTMTIRRHTQETAERLEKDMPDEPDPYFYGMPMLWDQMPEPASPLTVGIDGGYIHARDGNNRKAGWFEAIVGKSIPVEGDTKRFAFVNQYEERPQRHLIEALKMQGLSMRQSITFLSDGGDTVRNLQDQLVPYAEYILDWFHITMRITTLKQMAKSFTSLEETQGRRNSGWRRLSGTSGTETHFMPCRRSLGYMRMCRGSNQKRRPTRNGMPVLPSRCRNCTHTLKTTDRLSRIMANGTAMEKQSQRLL